MQLIISCVGSPLKLMQDAGIWVWPEKVSYALVTLVCLCYPLLSWVSTFYLFLRGFQFPVWSCLSGSLDGVFIANKKCSIDCSWSLRYTTEKAQRYNIFECIMGKAICAWQLLHSGTAFQCSPFTLAVGTSEQAHASETEASGPVWGITGCLQLVVRASQPSVFSFVCSGSEGCNSSWEVCGGLHLVCGYNPESDSHCRWLCQWRSVVSSYSDCHQQGWCARICSKDCFWGENNCSQFPFKMS